MSEEQITPELWKKTIEEHIEYLKLIESTNIRTAEDLHLKAEMANKIRQNLEGLLYRSGLQK